MKSELTASQRDVRSPLGVQHKSRSSLTAHEHTSVKLLQLDIKLIARSKARPTDDNPYHREITITDSECSVDDYCIQIYFEACLLPRAVANGWALKETVNWTSFNDQITSAPMKSYVFNLATDIVQLEENPIFRELVKLNYNFNIDKPIFCDRIMDICSAG